MEYKSFGFEVTKADDKDGRGFIEGYASVFDVVDSYGDIVDKGAFKKTLQEHPKVKVYWQHYDLAGSQEWGHEDDHGLKVCGGLNLRTRTGGDAYEFARAGDVDSLSIGFSTIKEEYDKQVRHLKEVRLFEWSLVDFPANEDALLTDVRSAADLDRHLRAILGVGNLSDMERLPKELLTKSIDRLQALLKSEPDGSTRSGEPPKTKDEPIALDHSIREVLGWAKQTGVI